MHRSEVQKVWTIASPRTWISPHERLVFTYTLSNRKRLPFGGPYLARQGKLAPQIWTFRPGMNMSHVSRPPLHRIPQSRRIREGEVMNSTSQQHYHLASAPPQKVASIRSKHAQK